MKNMTNDTAAIPPRSAQRPHRDHAPHEREHIQFMHIAPQQMKNAILYLYSKHFWSKFLCVRLPHQSAWSMLIEVRRLESFEAALCFDIYFDHIAKSLIRLPSAIKNKKELRILKNKYIFVQLVLLEIEQLHRITSSKRDANGLVTKLFDK